jgi:hypothetical protein
MHKGLQAAARAFIAPGSELPEKLAGGLGLGARKPLKRGDSRHGTPLAAFHSGGRLGRPVSASDQDHQVTWELRPHYELHGHSKVRVGYDLALFARHPLPLGDDPGCAECARIHGTLQDVAVAALPEASHHSRVSFSPFVAAFRMRPESKWAAEIELVVEISHPGTVVPADVDEERYVHEMEERLEELGAQHKTWR